MSFAAARRLLQEVWGYPRFRSGQAAGVRAAMAGRDAVVLLPTGSGKSLCYQVPAAVARRAGRGTTLVVSPLIALIEDQLNGLRGRGLHVGAVHSHMDASQRKEALAAFREGAFDLFYFSPERAAMPEFRYALSTSKVAFLAIDEAHCMSQWGHDFRPDYLRLDELRGLIDAPILALTATATPRVVDEICERLQLRDPEIVRGDFARPNLSFAVRHIEGHEARVEATIEGLERAGLRGRGEGGRAIVYCATRKTTEKVAKALESAGFAAGWYHAGRSETARQRAQRAFELRRTRVLVATNAFGMGVDLPDVRAIVHFQCPGSLEAYYQEAGRAGRDGRPATCTLFFDASDVATQRRLLSVAHPTAEATRPRDDALATIERYAHALQCRQVSLCAHFSGDASHRPCGLCDVCSDRDAVLRDQTSAPEPADDLAVPTEAHPLIVQAVARLGRPVALHALADALRGGRAKHLSRGALLGIPEYGALSEHAPEAIRAAIKACVERGELHAQGPAARRQVYFERGAGARSHAPVSKSDAALERALERFRGERARKEGVGVGRIFAKRVIGALVRRRPATLEELGEIAGLDHARVARYGADILTILNEERA